MTLQGQGGYETTVQLHMRGVGREPALPVNSKSTSRSESDLDEGYLTETSDMNSVKKGSPEPKILLSLVDKVELLNILEYLEAEPTITSDKGPKNK